MSEEPKRITFRPVGHRDELPAVVLAPGERAVTVIDRNGDVTELPPLEAKEGIPPVVVLPPEGDEIIPRPPGRARTTFEKVTE